MKTYVEHQKFRVWLKDAALRPDRAWRVVMRYHLLKNLRSWWVLGLAIVVVVISLIALAVASVEWGSGRPWSTPNGFTFTGLASSYLVVAAAFSLLIGAPMFSEDLRFQAPLFYFSRPLRPLHYYLGKVGVLAAALVATVIAPVLLFAFTMLTIGVPRAAAPTGEYGWRGMESVAVWEIETVNTVGDWAYGAMITIVGLIVTCAFLVSITGLVSVYTKRFWHTAVGVVVLLGGWGIVGMMGAEINDSAWGYIGGPFGWFFLMFVNPMTARFDPWGNGFMDGEPYPEVADWFPALVLSHVILIALTALATWLTLRRLNQQEALL